MTARPIRVAFPLIGGGNWTGGLVYLKNTLRLIGRRLPDRIEASVFLTEGEFAQYAGDLEPLAEGRLIRVPRIERIGRGKSLFRAMATGRDSTLESLLRKASIDVSMEVANFYGKRFRIPVVAWLPDFQHRHMPEMFTRANWWSRELGFRAQIRHGRTMMVSSNTALADMERFYPNSRGHGHVVRFASDLPIADIVSRAQAVSSSYGLPRRFFYVPNQFWRHKNHALVVSALAEILRSPGSQPAPMVVLSGLGKDPRNPDHFPSLMREVESAGLGQHFRYLGMIPYDHVLALIAKCEAMINPSLFEGWSTPIEEAKALGTPLLLSDIAIHREQAPDSLFFDSRSRESLARALREAWQRPLRPAHDLLRLEGAQRLRLDQHAQSLAKAITSARMTPQSGKDTG